MTNRSRVCCATVTPSGKPVRATGYGNPPVSQAARRREGARKFSSRPLFAERSENLHMGTSDTHAKTKRVPEFRPFFVPKGPVRIAQRFNAGSNGAMRPVPKGRLKVACRESLAQSVFSRPFGTCAALVHHPALKHGATVDCPSGTRPGVRAIQTGGILSCARIATSKS